MSGNSQNAFLEKELDRELLSARFNVQTKWHVITGAPCSGKTTLIDLLADQGFQTAPESARLYIEGEFARGRTIEEVRADPAAMTRLVYDLMIKREMGLRVDEITFLDRGLPDAPAFYRIAGMNPDQVVPDCFMHRYASVFMLDRLPYQVDGVRIADDPTAEYYDAWIDRDYRTIGYNIVRVPVLPPEERLAYVLERLSER